MATQELAQIEPFDIYGNWTVKEIELEQGSPPIGIEAGKSRIRIRNKMDTHILQKKPNVNDVQWNGSASEIQLVEITDSLRRNAGFVLGATIHLNNAQHELSLGSEDSGVTLKVQVRPMKAGPHPGGSGSAGRP